MHVTYQTLGHNSAVTHERGSVLKNAPGSGNALRKFRCVNLLERIVGFSDK